MSEPAPIWIPRELWRFWLYRIWISNGDWFPTTGRHVWPG